MKVNELYKCKQINLCKQERKQQVNVNKGRVIHSISNLPSSTTVPIEASTRLHGDATFVSHGDKEWSFAEARS